MSKVYDYNMEMEELFADAEYQEWLAKHHDLSDEDLSEILGE